MIRPHITIDWTRWIKTRNMSAYFNIAGSNFISRIPQVVPLGITTRSRGKHKVNTGTMSLSIIPLKDKQVFGSPYHLLSSTFLSF